MRRASHYRWLAEPPTNGYQRTQPLAFLPECKRRRQTEGAELDAEVPEPAAVTVTWEKVPHVAGPQVSGGYFAITDLKHCVP